MLFVVCPSSQCVCGSLQVIVEGWPMLDNSGHKQPFNTELIQNVVYKTGIDYIKA